MPSTNDEAETQTEQTAPVAEEQAPAPATDAAAPEPETPPAIDAKADEAPAADTSSTAPETAVLGAASGSVHRLSLGDVQSSLPEWAARIEALRTSPTISELQERMRATDGRCAPVYLGENGGLLSGIEALAAAINLDLPHVSVVTIDAGDTGSAQAFLAGQAHSLP